MGIITAKLEEVQEQYNALREAPFGPERRKVVAEVLGDAEVFIENLLVFLRQAKNKYEADNK